MHDIHGIVGRTTKFKESTVLPFVIPSEAEESAVSPSQYRMLMEKVLFIGSNLTCPLAGAS
jgi:hypothetical protein